MKPTIPFSRGFTALGIVNPTLRDVGCVTDKSRSFYKASAGFVFATESYHTLRQLSRMVLSAKG